MDEDDPLRRLALRQLADPDLHGSSSWYTYARDIAHTYGLNLVGPCIHPWTKGTWKALLKEAIHGHWFAGLIRGAAAKTSLHWLDCRLLTRGRAHPIWSTTRTPRQARRAAIRAKLACGVYMLQDRAAKFSLADSPLCPLCGEEEEDTSHFLLRCKALQGTRDVFMARLHQLFEEADIRVKDQDEMCRVILNGGRGGEHIYDECDKSGKIHNKNFNTRAYRQKNTELNVILSSVCNDLCYMLHRERDILCILPSEGGSGAAEDT